MIAAAWSTAAATGVLALFAVVTAWYARKAFTEQSREVRLLQRQADVQQGELDRTADERRRAQAICVYLTGVPRLPDHTHPQVNSVKFNTRPPAVDVEVHNTSTQPIYGAKIHWIDLDSEVQVGDVDRIGVVGPGSYKYTSRSVPNGVHPYRLCPILAFRDASEQRWTRTRAGHLAPIDAALPDGAAVVGVTAVKQSPYQDVSLSIAEWGPPLARRSESSGNFSSDQGGAKSAANTTDSDR
jgi:hypothetical protein